MVPSQRHLFDLPDDIAYLNCAYMAPLMRAVTEAGCEGVEKKARSWKISPTDFFDESEQARALFAEIGLEGMEDRRPSKLSGGQQQRVAVARAVIGDPALVLADEPTANLDSVTSNALLDVMERLNRDHGTTFVFSTHDPRVMERARRLVRLVDGRIESDERHGPARETR